MTYIRNGVSKIGWNMMVLLSTVEFHQFIVLRIRGFTFELSVENLREVVIRPECFYLLVYRIFFFQI